MCGVTGVIDFSGPPGGAADLRRMTLALKHRGPDDEGLYLSPEPGAAVGLGHRRLSIIDLSPQGRQPLSNENGSIWVAFNGEIYNFQALRRELSHLGHGFRSHTDTEVIVHAYEEWGLDCLNRLEGMFAFALWDGLRQRLLAARDRMGEKPFYYWQQGPLLLFASEPKALLTHPRFDPALDACSLSRYLLFECVPAPYSIFAGMRKLPPGHYLLADAQGLRVESYWRLADYLNGTRHQETLEDNAADLRQRLDQAVQSRLVADVPVGVFLSGGLDSSTVVALAAAHCGSEKVKTFAIGFQEPSFDESGYARLVARHFGTEHHEEIFSARRVIELLGQALEGLDEPLADASIIPTYLLSGFAAQYVKVALGGDGGDELFAGYPTFQAEKVASWATRLPGALWRQVLNPLIQALPVGLNNLSLDFRLKQFAKGLPYPPPRRGLLWLAACGWEEQRSLLHPDLLYGFNGFNPYQEISDRLAGPSFTQPVDQALYTYSQYYLPEDILVKVDRASMAHGLEVRAPFLQRELVEYVTGLPSSLKMKGLTGKYILRRAVGDLLPPAILKRPKKGFGIPLSRWFKKELKELLLETLSPRRLRETGLFHPPAVQRLIDEHLNGVRDNRKPLWALTAFEIWRQLYLRNATAERGVVT
jgi:asparagine synthase (glutamine-hydrolysing)